MPDPKRNLRIAEGMGAMKRGDYMRAAQAFEAVIHKNKNDADALHWLGAIAVARGLPSDAAQFFERLSRIKPRDAGAHANLGKARFASGDARGAILSLDRALAIDPSMSPALATRADALNRLGRVEEALELLKPLIACGEEHPEIAHAAATLLAQSGDHEQAVIVARRSVNSTGQVDPLMRRNLGFVLGQSLDALGRIEEAFESFCCANAVAIPGSRFEPAEFVREVNDQIAYFTPARLRGLIRASQKSSAPVLVTGVARSGTTLIEQIIHAHPRGFGAGELPDIDIMATGVGERIGSAALYPKCLMEMKESTANEMASEYVKKLFTFAPKAIRIVDKNLHAIMHLGLVWQVLPGATVVHCRRDPIANGLSCFMTALSPRLHPYASDLTHIGVFIRETERLASHWRSVLDVNLLEARYEDLVAHPETQTRRMIAGIGLEWDDACLRYHEADRMVRTLSYDQVRRPIYLSSVDRHRRYERFLDPLIEALRT